MDITKIKIGGESYDIKDVTARTTFSENQEALVRNIMMYGVADISAYTAAQLAEMAANMQKYGVPFTDGLTAEQLAQMLENMQRYGIADITGLTPEQLAELEAAHQAQTGVSESDPIFNAHIASKLAGTVDANGILTLINE